MEESNTPGVVQPSLPEFENQVVVAVATKLNGSGQRITRPLHVGAKVILLVEAEVTGVDHKKTKDGLQRVQTLAVSDLYESEGKDGKKLLSAARLRHKKADDARSGRAGLPGVDEAVEGVTGPEVTVDGSGTALTPDEVAAARGESRPASGEETPEPVVLVFSDESRALWPDDFADPNLENEPFAGDFLINPNISVEDPDSIQQLQVVRVLDSDTGELIEEWTAEQEDARLLDLERELEEKEKAEEVTPPKKTKGKGKAKLAVVGEDGPELANITEASRIEPAEPELDADVEVTE